jgi:hypothetical protein
MFNKEALAEAWNSALAGLEAAGEDVPALLRQAADNVAKHGHGKHTFPAVMPADDPAAPAESGGETKPWFPELRSEVWLVGSNRVWTVRGVDERDKEALLESDGEVLGWRTVHALKPVAHGDHSELYSPAAGAKPPADAPITRAELRRVIEAGRKAVEAMGSPAFGFHAVLDELKALEDQEGHKGNQG